MVKIAINLSPLLRERQNLASEIIRQGIDSLLPEDWHQQKLGLPSSGDLTCVTPEMFEACIGKPIPPRAPDFILLGIDQGRREDWGIVCDFYIPQGTEFRNFYQLSDKTIRVVRWAGDFQRGDLARIIGTYRIQYGIIDNEPNIESAGRIGDRFPIQMADQQESLEDEFVEKFVFDGGQKYKCWKIRYKKFMHTVLMNFTLKASDGHPLYRFPLAWKKWLYLPNNERSPMKHFMSPSYDPDSGKWERQEDHIDDMYFAAMFCEAAFAIYLRTYSKDRKWARLIS